MFLKKADDDGVKPEGLAFVHGRNECGLFPECMSAPEIFSLVFSECMSAPEIFS